MVDGREESILELYQPVLQHHRVTTEGSKAYFRDVGAEQPSRLSGA